MAVKSAHDPDLWVSRSNLSTHMYVARQLGFLHRCHHSATILTQSHHLPHWVYIWHCICGLHRSVRVVARTWVWKTVNPFS